jgi:serine protease Do
MDSTVADIYGLPVGAYVAEVEDGYCAQKAGIRAKDIIIAVGDVSVQNINDLTRGLREYEPGDRAKISVYRAGQVLEILVVLDERPASAG